MSACAVRVVDVLGSKYVNTSAGQVGRLVPSAIVREFRMWTAC